MRWAEWLRDDSLISRLVFRAYRPELGRYGDGAALDAAAAVFVADSTAPVTFLIKPGEGLQATGHGMTRCPCY